METGVEPKTGMDVDYRNYQCHMRLVETSVVCLLFDEPVTPAAEECVRTLLLVQLEDGAQYAYIGEIKRVIDRFMYYWTETIDNSVIEADSLANSITKEQLQEMAVKTILTHQQLQEDFCSSFLPARTPAEREIYDTIEESYNALLSSLVNVQADVDDIELLEQAQHLAKSMFNQCIQLISRIFQFTHNFMGLLLADRLNDLRVSLEDVFSRPNKCLSILKEAWEEEHREMPDHLYYVNKKLLQASRLDIVSNEEIAEISTELERAQSKVNKHRELDPWVAQQLRQEVQYWRSRLEEFHELEETLLGLQVAWHRTDQQQKDYQRLKKATPPRPTVPCWRYIEDNLSQRKTFIENQIQNSANALITFFGVPGLDRALLRDHAGEFYMDDYGHKVYIYNNLEKLLHVDCDGNFIQHPSIAAHCYDEVGRYTVDERGARIYQLAPCTSRYYLRADDVLEKVTSDCGHSHTHNDDCKMATQVRATEILPDPTTALHIKKGSMDPEVAKYLWDSFAHVLPHALRDLGVARPRNPAHRLAHRLLAYQYGRTYTEAQKMKTEIEHVRRIVYEEHLQRDKQASLLWKGRQVRARSGEMWDDAHTWALQHASSLQTQIERGIWFFG